MQNSLKAVLFLLLLTSMELSAVEKDSKVAISLISMRMDYREYDNSGSILDSEKSNFLDIAGIGLKYSYKLLKAEDTYSQIDVNYMGVYGHTDYVGSFLGSGNPYGSVTSKTHNSVHDIEVVYKKYHYMGGPFELHYGLGVGYRSWKRELSASQIETYKWFSLRPLIGLQILSTKVLSFGIETQYQYGINPTMDSSNPSASFDLGSADIIQVDMNINYIYNSDIDLFTKFRFEEQSIDRSNVVVVGSTGYFEPDSTAKNQYLEIGLAFKF
ncbi:MAG: hypothetical protein QM497_06290 [Sulfurimonas sp.]